MFKKVNKKKNSPIYYLFLNLRIKDFNYFIKRFYFKIGYNYLDDNNNSLFHYIQHPMQYIILCKYGKINKLNLLKCKNKNKENILHTFLKRKNIKFIDRYFI